MHRFLYLRDISLNGLQALSQSHILLTTARRSNTKCSHCCSGRYVHNFLFNHRLSTMSTKASVEPTKIRKKRMKSNKKYAELLVVGESSTVQQKAKVQNLGPEDLKRLALSNLDLNELYKLKYISKSNAAIVANEHAYSNLIDIDNLPSKDIFSSDFITDFLNTSGPIVKYEFYNPQKRKDETIVQKYDNLFSRNIPIYCDTKLALEEEQKVQQEEDRELELVDFIASDARLLQRFLESEYDPDEHLEDELKSNVIVRTPPCRPVIDIDRSDVAMTGSGTATGLQANVATPNGKSAERSKQPLDIEAKRESIVRSLSSYIEVCNSLRYISRPLSALQYHRRRTAKRHAHFPALHDASIYTGLLRGFAARADWPRMEEALKWAREDGVLLDVDGHAAVLECLGRLDVAGSCLREMRRAARDLRDAGITFDTIMNQALFVNDQRTFVLRTLRCCDPNYEPTYATPIPHYDNKLLNRLNCPEQLERIPMRPTTSEKKGAFNLPLNGPCSELKLLDALNEQLEIEHNVYVKIKSVENSSSSGPSRTGVVSEHRKTLDMHRELWHTAAQSALSRDLAALTARGMGPSCSSHLSLEPYLRSVPARDIVSIIVTEAERIAQASETYSPTAGQLHRDLGGKVYARYRLLRRVKSGVQDKITTIHKLYCAHYAQLHDIEHGPEPQPLHLHLLNGRQRWQWLERYLIAEGASAALEHRDWPTATVQQVGRFLYHIVMHDLKVDVNALHRISPSGPNYLPAFYTVFRNQSRLIKEEVKPHPILFRLYRAAQPDTLTFPAYELPMLCPPRPWARAEAHAGGYLAAPCDVVRLPPQAQVQRERLSANVRDMYPALDALNQLADVPWRVNVGILDVALKVFREGGSARLNVPESPSSLDHREEDASGSDSKEPTPTPSLRQRLQLRRRKAEMYSMWCDCLYRLSLANHYRDKVFWLPHNMDFRGRVYPVPPHLNHLGSDLARSMLVFAESRPLGPKGLDWLKIHLVNLTGAKKRDPVAVRLLFANEHMDDILDSADKPLSGRQWWADSDEPWQTLACCMEIARVVRWSGGDSDECPSHFPVHQDGSCNGLQHYAALGRDSAGARTVNLSNASEPQDVYSSVVTLVEERRRRDADAGLQIAQILDGHVKRKVIKQTVMTTVYGVTRFGARLQIARQLKEMGAGVSPFPREHVWAASSYLTTRTFESLRSMFTSAREIQDWFTECARLIASVCGRSVEWRTPLGLPVVQPYYRYRIAGGGGNQYAIDKHEKPNVMKQKNAFPPNFIHSLDSSHMMLTSLYAERAGITFVSVHDCFWTHPSTVHIMNKICRDQFVALHSEPILDDLSSFLSNLYSYNECDILDDGSVSDLTKKKLNRILHKLPNTGDFDIRQVLNSTYFFS